MINLPTLHPVSKKQNGMKISQYPESIKVHMKQESSLNEDEGIAIIDL